MNKKIFRYCIGFLTCIALLFSLNIKPTYAGSYRFQVNGTTLYDGNGNEFIMRGANYPHAWFSSEYKTAIPAIAKKGFNCVRIVVSNGTRWTKTSYQELQQLISLCKQNSLVAILEVHDTTGLDDTYSLDQAVNYWIEMKTLLQQNENYVIVNIANEWYGTWDDGTSWKNGYISAIQKLRNANISNTLMVDCAGWGQYPKVIFDHGNSVLQADPLKNTMFSIHMYEYAGGDSNTVKYNMEQVLNKNLCLTIGEFGGYHSNGDVDEDEIMRSGNSKKVGWIAWSWKGNNSDLNYLDLAYDWAGNSLTQFGNRVIYGTDGVQQTSKTCSVFQ
ncbi:MAG: cellulase family glycosylhydrolase [Firmicutes bacterium]|uniref:Cellulase family glycosylhydrolase n=1 Tax=Candidatus Scybalomonas excrementavium TaxID=2840943 RepID=A0A9D9N7Y3_9FIRM|nr:cellulase family glycosylhydrolase [Candidatus Scybalomonas excrementavium]